MPTDDMPDEDHLAAALLEAARGGLETAAWNALGDILVSVGVLDREIANAGLTGPQILVAAEEFLKHTYVGPDTHTPMRGDKFEAWIKWWRDQHITDEVGPRHPAWTAIDAMLDDYRMHADTGTPLSEEVEEPGGTDAG